MRGSHVAAAIAAAAASGWTSSPASANTWAGSSTYSPTAAGARPPRWLSQATARRGRRTTAPTPPPPGARTGTRMPRMTRTIHVTGATAGFGAAIVERFAAAGWRIVATGRRTERLQALVDRHGADRMHAAAFDIRDLDAMQAALDAIPAPFRDIDVLVNNA